MRLIFAYKEIVVSMVILVNGISNAFWIEQNATAVSVMTAVYVPVCFPLIPLSMTYTMYTKMVVAQV